MAFGRFPGVSEVTSSAGLQSDIWDLLPGQENAQQIDLGGSDV